MKTATLDVGGMLSLLDYQAVENQLGSIPGVQRATASVASNSVTVEYDETVTSVAALKAKINECGFHCTGQIMPKHVCEPRPVDEHGMHIGHTAHEPAAAPAAATAAVPMSHDSLVFTVPIFIYSPMGNMFTPPAPPFGLRLDLWLFFLASAAVLYSAWPFVIAAMRALRNRILNMAVLVLLSVRRSPNFPLLGDLQRHFASRFCQAALGRIASLIRPDLISVTDRSIAGPTITACGAPVPQNQRAVARAA